jgi:hypothetical protein
MTDALRERLGGGILSGIEYVNGILHSLEKNIPLNHRELEQIIHFHPQRIERSLGHITSLSVQDWRKKHRLFVTTFTNPSRPEIISLSRCVYEIMKPRDIALQESRCIADAFRYATHEHHTSLVNWDMCSYCTKMGYTIDYTDSCLMEDMIEEFVVLNHLSFHTIAIKEQDYRFVLADEHLKCSWREFYLSSVPCQRSICYPCYEEIVKGADSCSSSFA